MKVMKFGTGEREKEIVSCTMEEKAIIDRLLAQSRVGDQAMLCPRCGRIMLKSSGNEADPVQIVE